MKTTVNFFFEVDEKTGPDDPETLLEEFDLPNGDEEVEHNNPHLSLEALDVLAEFDGHMLS